MGLLAEPLPESLHRFPLLDHPSTIDGDTVRALIDRGWGDTRKTGLRIWGCDAPEKRTRKNLLERRAGQLVTRVTDRWILDRDHGLQAFASSEVKSKYAGRTIGRLYFADYSDPALDLGSFLLAGGFVRPYYGSKREAWEDSELSAIIAKAEAFLAYTDRR